MTELILFRGIRGLGAGMIFSNVFTSVADIFPDPANRARYQGVFSGVFALSSVVGPTLGGWVTDNLDWRWIFYINLPLGIFSLFALPFVLPQSGRRWQARIDFLGAATVTASVVSLLLSLSWVGHGDAWSSGRVIAGFVISAILLAVFVPIELRAPEPVIPLSLFRSRVFTSSSLLMFCVGIGMFGIILYLHLPHLAPATGVHRRPDGGQDAPGAFGPEVAGVYLRTECCFARRTVQEDPDAGHRLG